MSLKIWVCLHSCRCCFLPNYAKSGEIPTKFEFMAVRDHPSFQSHLSWCHIESACATSY